MRVLWREGFGVRGNELQGDGDSTWDELMQCIDQKHQEGTSFCEEQ